MSAVGARLDEQGLYAAAEHAALVPVARVRQPEAFAGDQGAGLEANHSPTGRRSSVIVRSGFTNV